MPKTIEPRDRSVRSAALLAGIGLLVMTVVAVFAFFVVLEPLVTPGNAARTATDIRASKGLFQLGIGAWVVTVVLDVVVAWALFRVFRTVSRRLAIAAASARVIYAGILGVATAQLVEAFRLLSHHAGSAVPSAATQAQALQKIDAFNSVYDFGLVLFGIHLLLIGLLAYRSGYVARIVGALVGIAGFGYVFDSALAAVSPDSSLEISVVTGFGEFALALWLVIRGRRITLGGAIPSDAPADLTRIEPAPVGT